MKIESLELPGVRLITPTIHEDARGHFVELLPLEASELQALDDSFVQVNLSHSLPGVIRGLHYANPPQGKLVSCVEGKILDVIADVRTGSSTFGQHIAVTLKSSLRQLLWIPGGFAHGFAVLEDQPATVVYWVDSRFDLATEAGVAWDDPILNISWPTKSPILSQRDKDLPRLQRGGIEA
jgi:dTDP-4-dehydrorhamnose 3,5-epimerase